MEQVRLIKHGEPLTPEVANRPIEDLVQWLSILTQRVDSYQDISSNILYDQPLDESVFVGAPVYFNRSTGKYHLAYLASRVEMDQVVAEDSCYALGIVSKKTSSKSGHICLGGVVEIDFEENVGNQNAHFDYRTLGLRYLSSIPGRVVAQPPSVSVPLAFVLAAGLGKATILVSICLDRIMSGHRHHRLPMEARPSGSWSLGSTEITGIDRTMEGWLPIGEFNADRLQIPPDAVFGYNLDASPIREHFPVIIPSAFKVFWSQYTNEDDPTPVIGEIYDDLYEVTSDGIWWKSTEYLPWYMECSWSAGQPADPAMPIPLAMMAYYVSITYNTDDAVVTSLTPAPLSGLEITNIRTRAPAIRGDLLIDLDLKNKRASDQFMGHLALKCVGDGYENATHSCDEGNGVPVKNAFFFGPVVEGIRLDSIFGSIRSEDCVETADGWPSGRITLDMGDAWGRLPLPVQSVHLDQMRDAFIGGMVAMSFFPGQKSGFSGSIYLPWFNREKADVRIRFTLVCGSPGRIMSTAFTGRYMIIQSPETCDTSVPLPMSIPSLCNPQGDDNTLKFDFDVEVPEAQMYFCVNSEPITVEPGDMLWFSWHRETGNEPLSVIRMEALFQDSDD